MARFWFAAVFILLIILLGCSQQPGQINSVPEPGKMAGGANESVDELEKADPGAMPGKVSGSEPEGDAMPRKGQQNNGSTAEGALQKSVYVPFTKAGYDSAKASGKRIFLEFYANWCPICSRQKPVIEGAFARLDDPSIVGFHVNYNDSETDADEEALARKFGITYQHTHVLIDSSEKQLVPKSSESLSEQELIAFIEGGS